MRLDILTRICKHWCAITFNNSALWNEVELPDISRERPSLLLERSEGAPLDISLGLADAWYRGFIGYLATFQRVVFVYCRFRPLCYSSTRRQFHS